MKLIFELGRVLILTIGNKIALFGCDFGGFLRKMLRLAQLVLRFFTKNSLVSLKKCLFSCTKSKSKHALNVKIFLYFSLFFASLLCPVGALYAQSGDPIRPQIPGSIFQGTSSAQNFVNAGTAGTALLVNTALHAGEGRIVGRCVLGDDSATAGNSPNPMLLEPCRNLVLVLTDKENRIWGQVQTARTGEFGFNTQSGPNYFIHSGSPDYTLGKGSDEAHKSGDSVIITLIKRKAQ